MYKNSCGFVCEDFPKENQMLQTRNDLGLSTKPQLFLYGVMFCFLFFQFLLKVPFQTKLSVFSVLQVLNNSRF